MFKITKETLKQDIDQATSKLLELAESSCWNNISTECVYILSKIQDDDTDFEQQRIKRKRINDRVIPRSLDQIIPELEEIYCEIYDINLFIYQSKKHKTIVDIRYFINSNLGSNQSRNGPNPLPMLHSKIAIPPYGMERTQKFDVNWELGGLRHKWKMFRWVRNMRTLNK